ncbi:L-aminoadipate-semialdehyde dehydrogenase [Batrachochytrium salamandrivorans]|nr:L-aminoadipate-semialdehyde dehydrogenase [Batrachochytrium salamandrivorans]
MPGAAQLERWLLRLTALTELMLPTDYPRPVPVHTVEAELLTDIKESTAMAIMQLSFSAAQSLVSGGSSSSVTNCNDNAVLGSPPSPFTILLAAFSVLLHRYTGEHDITIGSSSVSSNPLVLRTSISGSNTFLQVVESILKTEADALSDEVPFAALVDAMMCAHASAYDDVTSHPALFKVRFFNLTDTTAQTLASSTTSSNCDLTVFISQAPTLRRMLPIQIKMVYNAVLFSASRIQDIFDQLQLLLESAAANPSLPINQISLVTPKSKAALPDPRADLDWGGFHGAIPDIFSANARNHPDMPCVLESQPSGLIRTFTYQKINQAANIVAHYLLNNGIQREDVVVLYSYRGVDLVIAIMGVLKAGATFSVIDPAYPPARQIVYLSVAQPRGLIVLSKAGVLDKSVRTYITDKLSIVCEIPSLLISDDGSLYGGSTPQMSSKDSESVDVLAHLCDTSGVDPNIVIGPDSIGTLSFTSGSTGTPKGVCGRHYSLTHFYPWMSREFQLTSAERFTMLSGIAHDPIQRDIFTPLFLGARLCIPTGEDIGSPGSLAKWMAEQQITITNLTPAMGQLLSANATHHIPTLRHAFFVGDVLTKRDVLRLQHLAPNTHVINMYGTTETQRAVSFLTIPPISSNPAYLMDEKDIIPAGKGMKDVQLLIVNSCNMLCGVGEVGEIYVRSGGLAEGYLSLPEATASKFLPNPFNPKVEDTITVSEANPSSYYHGPRDRLYRTGDLGRYRPDGSVECTGRADDQVKIRGFRIELGEIDTHLSQHPSVRENVTLVRRDKFEEMTLVTYFVPMSALDNVAETISDIRAYLKQKLPSYAIPTVIVPIARMPLTPNGKVDKNILPFPDTALSKAQDATSDTANSSDLTPFQSKVCQIWALLLNLPMTSIGLNDHFFEIGGHSILATRLVFELRKEFTIEVPLGIVYKSPTVFEMARAIERSRGGDLVISSVPLASQGASDMESSNIRRDSNLDVLQSPEDELFDYAADLDVVDDLSISASNLPEYTHMTLSSGTATLFLTGATGFLGAFILGSLLSRFPGAKIICLARAKSDAAALERIIDSSQRHLVWKQEWLEAGRVHALAGDLGADMFGLTVEHWNDLAEKVDVIVHNGALVHWVYPYAKLRSANVIGTKTALRLATSHHLKALHFVSSTSVLDTEEYMRKQEAGTSVLESDNLEGSRYSLRSGYGQTKWVAERLVMRANSRGVPTTIIRPGYIVGDSHTGVTNTDDFLWRLVKGCIQLGKVPLISNTINMCSVDYVAECISEIVASPKSSTLGVFHMWNRDRFRFNDMFSSLSKLGCSLEQCEYVYWRTSLMEFTLSSKDSALYPLLHFVLDDLPTSTKSPELDDANTMAIIAETKVQCANMLDLMPLYLGYLVAVEFLEASSTSSLPSLEVWSTTRGVSRSGN